ncbi:hypothetical protein SAMN04488543_0346 [Friedmanniella luteola]|uniref:DUF4352 domain-containing protein n=1 Tax=Friedmanniella luteola TaxID=546871 RepID=A0A1H1LMA3_9ACTN|nr:hypothetical protein [Friedmanniella luteola]SDR75653.1 hypothetical protein SAMN04488543_0346 [Friedmanniella luteola]
MAADSPRPWLVRLALALAAVAVLVAAVLVVRQVRADPAATPAPTVPTASAGPSAPASPAATPAVSTSPSAAPSPSASPSSSARTPTATASGRTSPSATASGRDQPEQDPAPTSAVSTKPPVPLDEPEEVDEGLTARVSRLEAVQGEASGPGEVSGPAVRATVTLTNRSREEVDLSSTVVNLFYTADQTPGSALSGPGTKALPTAVRAGEKATGTFVFAVPEDDRSEVLITVDYSVDTPVVAFRGAAPR